MTPTSTFKGVTNGSPFRDLHWTPLEGPGTFLDAVSSRTIYACIILASMNVECGVVRGGACSPTALTPKDLPRDSPSIGIMV